MSVGQVDSKITLMTPGWQSLITTLINMDGRLLFLLNRNYSVEKLDRTIPFFYREILDCFQELRNNYEDPWKRKFILWNNRDINIQTNRPFGRPGGIKMLFFFFVQDLLNNQGTYLSVTTRIHR